MKCFVKIFASILLCTIGSVSASDSPSWQISGTNEGWNDDALVLKYFHNSELQRQWGWHLLRTYRFNGNENVLDFGCGDGKITAEVSHFVPQGRLLGIDVSKTMINFASRCFPASYYPNLTFEHTDLSEEISTEEYDLIYSLCVFHLVPNPIQLLKSLQQRLKDNGQLLLVIPAGNSPAFFQAADETFDKYHLPKPWLSRVRGNNHVTMRTQEGCLNCLAKADLEPISVVAYDTPTAFYNKQDLVDWMIGTVTANWHVPLEVADPFFHDLIDRMTELDSTVVNTSGAYHMKLSRIEVIAKKANLKD
jgi:trans-aconitate 2-methyltransferase